MLLKIKGNYEHDFTAEINLDEFLPATAERMNKLITLFVDVSTDPEAAAETVYNYISGKICELKEERNGMFPEDPIDKKKISKINAELKRYISNINALLKKYDFPELEADEAEIKMHAAKVYSRQKGNTAVEYNGLTFEKGGLTFDAYKKQCGKNSFYIIMLHGTGLQVATASRKSDIITEVTPKILKIINDQRDHLQKEINNFKEMMISAGYITEQRAENISNNNNNEKQEVENMSDYAFTETTLTCKGKGFPCEYNISDTGAVLAFVIIGEKSNGRKEKQKIVFNPEHSDYPAALEAAKKASGTPEEKQELATAAAFGDIPDTNTGEQIAENAADLIAESENAAALEQEEKNESEADVSETTLEEKEKEIAQDPKQARGPVPEKTFIGETIQGNGWKILFDGALQRTRIIFEADPLDAARAALDAAGFYYSSNMNSWNKKLTFKAYRAAKTLSEELNRIYAA